MALEDVTAATDITGFTEGETLRIRSILGALYNNSTTARDMLEDWTGVQGNRLSFTFSKNDASARLGSGAVLFDFSLSQGRGYLDDTGVAAPATPLVLITPQLARAIEGLDDTWDPAYAGDYRGNAIDFANVIFGEIGIPLRNSAHGAGTQLDIGKSYSGGQDIDRSIVANTLTNPVLDTSPADVSRDLLLGDDGANTISSGRGHDWLYGMGGDDILNAGGGDDFLSGDTGDDLLSGGAGNDFIYGREDNDQLIGGLGSDTLVGGPGDDILDGQFDNDLLLGGLGDDRLFAGDGDDTLKGSNGADRLFGQLGDDLLSGEAGDDMLDAGRGDDTLLGGTGQDLLRGDAGDDLLSGGLGGDIINGATGNDVLMGGYGDDTLDGGAGNDVLNGGVGADEMTGGDGSDTFIFNTSRGDWQMISDFDSGTDEIRFAEVIGADGVLVSDGADADTNGDGRISALDDGWSVWNGGGLVFDGLDTDLYVGFVNPGQTLLASDIV